MVPRAAFTSITRRLKSEIKVPLIASNRINDPEVAESVLARGDADMVSMARPFLADPHFVNKRRGGRADEINICIACATRPASTIAFVGQVTSCLVNPLAVARPNCASNRQRRAKKVIVVRAGPAGLACATTAASSVDNNDNDFAEDVRAGWRPVQHMRMIPGKRGMTIRCSIFAVDW